MYWFFKIILHKREKNTYLMCSTPLPEKGKKRRKFEENRKGARKIGRERTHRLSKRNK